MKKNMVLLLLLTAFLAASVVPAFAQARGAFSIVCNVTGARVYLNGELAGYTKPTFSALLKPGTYQVRITMERYQPFETVINMSANPLNLPVNLVPEGGTTQRPGRFNLTVSANVAGAQVFVNNAPVGTTPLSMQVSRGNYSVRVTAPGYQDYLAAVNVLGHTAVNAVLQGYLLQLAVNSNVAGAQVYVNNALSGTAPFVGSFAPGSYAVRVSAPGYTDASTVVNLNRNETITLMLQASYVSVQIVIPQDFLDREHRGRDNRSRDPREQIRVFVDGQPYNDLSFSLTAGRHNLRIASGAFSFESDFDFAPGRNYVLEPMFSWRVR
jgi:hypothetical protein